MTIKYMTILRGLPGAGTTTLANRYKDKHKDSCYICSTDDYWVRPDGTYDFNYMLLGQSHLWNQKRVQDIIDKNMDVWYDTVVVIDNTNVTFNEMKPYIKMGVENGYHIEFKEPDVWWKYDVEECFRKNTHGVPYATILKMYQRFESQETVDQKLVEMFREEGWGSETKCSSRTK